MKKNSTMSYLALLMVFALFNVLAFVIPTEKTSTFWVAYAFSVVAFAVQIPLWKISFWKKENLKSKFLGISVVYVGIVYLVFQLIAFAILKMFPMIPSWLAVVVCSIILAMYALFAIAGQAGANEINRIDEKIKIKRAFVQFLQTDIEMLVEGESDAEIKAFLKKLAEKIRFSDPMSHEMLGDLESRISAKVEELKTSEDKKALVKEIDLLIRERNKKCEILKG